MTVWLKAQIIGPPMLVSAALYLVALVSMPAPVAVAAAALLTGVLGVLVCAGGGCRDPGAVGRRAAARRGRRTWPPH